MRKIPTVDSWTKEGKARARLILLERSPYGVDGGGVIGRDPREIGVHEFSVVGIASEGVRLLDVIRAKCLDCVGERAEEVRRCVSFTCPNWPYRMGANPFHRQALSDEERARRADRMRDLMRER